MWRIYNNKKLRWNDAGNADNIDDDDDVSDNDGYEAAGDNNDESDNWAFTTSDRNVLQFIF